MAGTWSTGRKVGGMLVGLVVAAGTLAAPVAGGSAESFVLREIHPGSSCFQGLGGGGVQEYGLELVGPAGGHRDEQTVSSDGVGQFEGCFAKPIRGGDRVRVSVEGTFSREVVVPRMRVAAIDRPGDRFTLVGDAGLDVALTIRRCPIGVGFNPTSCGAAVERTPTLNAAGTRAINLKGKLNLRGHQFIEVFHGSGFGDEFHVRADVPMLFVVAQRAQADANLPSGISATVRLLKPNGTLRGRATVKGTGDGGVGFTFRKNGKATKVRVRDRVVANRPKDATFVVPAGITAIKPATDRVNGRCFPNQRFAVTQSGSVVADGKANAKGNVSAIVDGVTQATSFQLRCQTKGGDLVTFTNGPT